MAVMGRAARRRRKKRKVKESRGKGRRMMMMAVVRMRMSKKVEMGKKRVEHGDGEGGTGWCGGDGDRLEMGGVELGERMEDAGREQELAGKIETKSHDDHHDQQQQQQPPQGYPRQDDDDGDNASKSSSHSSPSTPSRSLVPPPPEAHPPSSCNYHNDRPRRHFPTPPRPFTTPLPFPHLTRPTFFHYLFIAILLLFTLLRLLLQRLPSRLPLRYHPFQSTAGRDQTKTTTSTTTENSYRQHHRHGLGLCKVPRHVLVLLEHPRCASVQEMVQVLQVLHHARVETVTFQLGQPDRDSVQAMSMGMELVDAMVDEFWAGAEHVEGGEGGEHDEVGISMKSCDEVEVVWVGRAKARFVVVLDFQGGVLSRCAERLQDLLLHHHHELDQHKQQHQDDVHSPPPPPPPPLTETSFHVHMRSHRPEVDLVLCSTPYPSVYGSHPWHLRKAELVWFVGNKRVGPVLAWEGLRRFSECERRFGR